MRTTKTIVIQDGEVSYTYNLTKMSALGLQKWASRAICALAESGLLDLKDKDLNGGIAAMIDVMLHQGFGFLGKLDCDRVDKILAELIENTAKRTVGAAEVKVTQQDLESTLTEIESLFELEKECFLLNFPQFAPESQSDSLPSPQMESGTIKRGISVKSSHH